MESLLVLALLACPLVMGGMMWMMMRGQGKQADGQGTSSAKQSELTALQAQIDQLHAQQRDGGQVPPVGS